MTRRSLVCLAMVFGFAVPVLQGCGDDGSAERDEPAPAVASSLPHPDASETGSVSPPLEARTVILDLKQVAGRSEAEVASVLGDPTATDTARAGGRSFPKRIYRDGDIEIVFVEGLADWLTIFGEGKLPFSNEALPALGLAEARPTFSNPAAVIRWENISGIREVSVFPGQGRYAHYAYVLVNTEP